MKIKTKYKNLLLVGIAITLGLLMLSIVGCGNNTDSNTNKTKANPEFVDASKHLSLDTELQSVEDDGVTFQITAENNNNDLAEAPFQSTQLDITTLTIGNKSYKVDLTNNTNVYPPQVKIFVNGKQETTGLIIMTEKKQTITLKISCSDITTKDGYSDFKLYFNETTTRATAIKGTPKTESSNDSYLSCKKK